MDKKRIITNAVVCAICTVLIIFAAITGLVSNEVFAGAGKGKSAKIETIEQTGKVLSSFQNRLTSYNFDGETSAMDDADAKDEVEYKSLTVNVDSAAEMSYESGLNSYNDEKTEQSMSCDRQLTAYFTERASYYLTDFKIYSHAYSSMRSASGLKTEEHNMFMSCLMHIYLEENFAMVRIDRMEAVTDGEANKTAANALGKWVYFSNEENDEYRNVVSSLTSANDSNFKVFTVMSRYIKNAQYFKKDRQNYTLLAEYTDLFIRDMLTAQFGSLSYDPDTCNGSFKVDLSDKSKPQMRLEASSSFSQSRTKCDSFGSDLMIFSNINNTVISAPSINGALSPDELQDLVREN